MIVDGDNVSLAHVHAYVDAQLSEAQCQQLEDYFDANPDKFEMLQRYLAINDHFQAMFAPVLQETIPPALLQRLYSSDEDAFSSPLGSFKRLATRGSDFLFAKPLQWKGGLQKMLSRSRLHELRSRIPKNVMPVAAILARVPPSVKSQWYNGVQRLAPWRDKARPVLAKIGQSYRDVNVFAALSIAAVGFILAMPGSTDDANRLTNPGNWESQAVQAHMYYRNEGRRALEADADKQNQLLSWLSRRSGKEIRLIDFSELGYRNAGVVLLPTQDNYALVTIYENDELRKVTLYIGFRPAGKRSELACGALELAKSLCSWTSDKLLFAVVSDFTVPETQQLAQWMLQNYSMAYLISSTEWSFSQTLGTIKA